MNNETNQINRRDMYMKYNNSTIFSSNEGDNSAINPKSVLKKQINHSFNPRYKEKTAREEYMRQFWNKEIKDTTNFSQAKRFTKKVINAEDIICRDMYSSCSVRDYKLRRSKSVYLPRSGLSEKIVNDRNISSRKRKIEQMTSDIFFTKKPLSNEGKERNSLNAKNLSKAQQIRTKSNTISMNKSQGTNQTKTHRYNSHSLINNPKRILKRSKTELPAKSSFKRVNVFRKNYTSDFNDQKKAIISSGKRTNMTNVESVQYNFLSNNCSNDLLKNNVKHKQSNSYLGGIHNNKLITSQKSIDKYVISTLKCFNKVTGKELKENFYAKGLHVFNFEEKQDFLNCQKGVFTFKIRRNEYDSDYDNKISKINKELQKQNMSMSKVPITTKTVAQ